MISIGIDVSKEKNTVCIMRPDGEVLAAPFDLLHTMEDVLALVRHLKSYDEDVRVVLETTGHYHWPIVSLLVENDIFVACINPLQMKKYCAQSIRKGKTDRIDAIKIAQYGIAYWSSLTRCIADSDTYAELRIFSRQYYQYLTILMKAKINLGILLDQAMPGIQNILSDQEGRHNLTDFIRKYWHFGNVISKGEK